MKFSNAIMALAAVMLLSLGATSCRNTKEVGTSTAYYQFDPTFQSADASGRLTVRSWGQASSKGKAIEQAKKNAVSQLLFKGYQGAPGYMNRPLVQEVNARERYAEYFDRFFADGGEYRKFVKEASASDDSRLRSKTDAVQNLSVVVVLDVNKLREQLRKDGVIK